MSIFASNSTSAPALIQIPTFSSPERTQTQAEDGPSTNEQSKPAQALTRAEERQMRFKNANTKWESLGRMVEDQKGSGKSSLLQLMGNGLDIASAFGGKGKEKAAQDQVEKKRSTRVATGTGQPESNKGTEATSKEVGSPTKKKRARSEMEKEEGSKIGASSGKRVARKAESRQPGASVEAGTRDASRSVKDKSSAGTTKSAKANPPQSPPRVDLFPEPHPAIEPRPAAEVVKSTKGRVPRAALRKVLTEETSELGATTKSAAPSEHPRSPLSPVHTLANIEPEVRTRGDAAIPAAGGVEVVKKRRKPRAAPPTPAPVRRRSPSVAPVVEVPDHQEPDIVPDSQPVVTRAKQTRVAGKGGNGENSVGLREKKRQAAEEAEDPLGRDEPSKKSKLGAKRSAKEKDEQEPEMRMEEKVAAKTKDSTREEGTAGRKGAKKPAKTKRVADKVETERKKEAGLNIADPSHSPPPVPSRTLKNKKPLPKVAPPPRSPVAQVDSLSIPSLLSSPLRESQTTSKSKPKTKQLVVRFARLDSAQSEEGKVNVFDVLIESAKDAMKEVLEEFDGDDPDDRAKIAALKSYIATFRLSLLHRSNELSEYSALQRKLTASRAKSKKLKAELEELKAKGTKTKK
ncbi:hypothetical protein JCM16303_003789 [Sporobolomyces ruberrimus]